MGWRVWFTGIALLATGGTAWAEPAPLCGHSIEDALATARKVEASEVKDACLAEAISRLAAHVEALRTGKEGFGIIKADAYLHGTSKP
ncbi:MAG: hypothetical protein KDI55_20290 [Anaerolineae bacterium]|nr:hypothetical protein [Anaerolineae bacterium]